MVRATESYTIRERAERRSFLPLYSLLIATEPLPQETWDELGWRDGIGYADIGHLFYYAQRTTDGRIVVGGSRASAEALIRARAMGVAGMVLSGMLDKELRDFEAIQQRRRERNPGQDANPLPRHERQDALDRLVNER